jgi:hypothetical protein
VTIQAQTFTANVTGSLTEVDLWMDSASSSAISSVAIRATNSSTGYPTGSDLATSESATPTPTAGWVAFTFSTPYSVTHGTTYAIVFSTTLDDDAFAGLGAPSPSIYQQALELAGIGWEAQTAAGGYPVNFDFQEWVEPAAAPDSVTTTLAWDKPSVTAGVSTPLTLTETITYVNGTSTASYYATWDGLPTWFIPSGITCPAQVPTIGCSVHQFELGLTYPPSSAGATLTFTITDVAEPAASDVETPGVGHRQRLPQLRGRRRRR